MLCTPANVLITIGKNADMLTMMILAVTPSPNQSWMRGIRATDGVL